MMHLSTLLIAASSIYNAVPCLATSQDTLAPPPPTKPRYTFDDLWKLEKKFWDNFLYPANLKQTQGNESTVFTKDVSDAYITLPEGGTHQVNANPCPFAILGARSSRYYSHIRRR